ncbi:MAG TPA: DUF4942 domain-containing protein [Methylosinus sp.]|uniref:DUF4942 domain-containing protein n=1 Tax=Methylosinus sp. TaxID=427 RepID=UPI002F943028
MSATALPVPRQTIEDIVRAHDEALALYERAFDAMEIAQEALKAANLREREATAGQLRIFGGSSQVEEAKDFYAALALPERGRYLRTARKLLANGTWANLIKMTELERLMDAKAKEELRQQMAYVPDKVGFHGQIINQAEMDKGLPPITVENVYATLEKFRGDAGMIFCRGIANVFSALDRRFKSHDGFKVGGRIILTYAFDSWGHLNSGSIRDKLIDVERVFAVLDGHPEGSFQSAIDALVGRRVREASQSEHETPYFKIRAFKNGNAHLWLSRHDLVEKVNKLLAEYYGEVIADGATKEEDPLQNRKLTPARHFGFFPTPPEAVDEFFRGRGCVSGIPILRRREESRLRILEPSAGTGNLARRCVHSAAVMAEWSNRGRNYVDEYRFDNLVDCVEIQPELAAGLEAEGIYNRVIRADFLSLRPNAFEPYDLVVMNPPFDRERDLDHVTHALGFLKPGGQLFAIISAGTEFRETRKAVAFRALVERNGGSFRDLPPGSFRESGTNVNTVVVTMRRRMS